MSGEWHGGKGSGRRQMSISQDEWNSRWDAIFQRDLPVENAKVTSNNYSVAVDNEEQEDKENS